MKSKSLTNNNLQNYGSNAQLQAMGENLNKNSGYLNEDRAASNLPYASQIAPTGKQGRAFPSNSMLSPTVASTAGHIFNNTASSTAKMRNPLLDSKLEQPLKTGQTNTTGVQGISPLRSQNQPRADSKPTSADLQSDQFQGMNLSKINILKVSFKI